MGVRILLGFHRADLAKIPHSWNWNDQTRASHPSNRPSATFNFPLELDFFDLLDLPRLLSFEWLGSLTGKARYFNHKAAPQAALTFDPLRKPYSPNGGEFARICCVFSTTIPDRSFTPRISFCFLSSHLVCPSQQRRSESQIRSRQDGLRATC